MGVIILIFRSIEGPTFSSRTGRKCSADCSSFFPCVVFSVLCPCCRSDVSFYRSSTFSCRVMMLNGFFTCKRSLPRVCVDRRARVAFLYLCRMFRKVIDYLLRVLRFCDSTILEYPFSDFFSYKHVSPVVFNVFSLLMDTPNINSNVPLDIANYNG